MADKLGPVSVITGFFIALLPLIFGFAMTGNTIAVPRLGAFNALLGWVFVIIGVLSLYLFFTKK